MSPELPEPPVLRALPDLLAWAREARPGPAAPHGPLMLAVDGRSGAGKSSLARALVGSLPASPRAFLLSLDDVYPGWDGLAAAPGLLARGVLEPWSRGAPGRLRRWDWAADRPGGWWELPVPEVAVIEGVGSGTAPCRPYLAGLVWVELDEATRRARALARDGDGYRPHWERWAAQERALFAADDVRRHADLVIDASTGRVASG